MAFTPATARWNDFYSNPWPLLVYTSWNNFLLLFLFVGRTFISLQTGMNVYFHLYFTGIIFTFVFVPWSNLHFNFVYWNGLYFFTNWNDIFFSLYFTPLFVPLTFISISVWWNSLCVFTNWNDDVYFLLYFTLLFTTLIKFYFYFCLLEWSIRLYKLEWRLFFFIYLFVSWNNLLTSIQVERKTIGHKWENWRGNTIKQRVFLDSTTPQLHYIT